MTGEAVDQLLSDGAVVLAPDPRLGRRKRVDLLLDALPGAEPLNFENVPAVRFGAHVLMYRQVTHLGRPWESFKKRIQIPPDFIRAHYVAERAGLVPHFLGIYHFEDVTLFVDFETSTYVTRRANNSSAHVATNDLFQGWDRGFFSRQDSNGNRITTVRPDRFAQYLAQEQQQELPAIELLRDFNSYFLTQGRVEALDAVQEMHHANWPDQYQAEWAGFFLEYRLNRHLRSARATDWLTFQKSKTSGTLDYDLVIGDVDGTSFFGDLKASDDTHDEAPGNDAADLIRCITEYDRFWYVVYEHTTWRARDNGHLATRRWNHWRASVGHKQKRTRAFDELSYAARFKEAVDFHSMFILEVNTANLEVVLREFHQGRQPSGMARAVKVMIRKRNIDNFLILSDSRIGRTTPTS